MATDRVQVVMDLTSRLNVLRHSDVEARAELLSAIFGRPVPETLTLYPPFYCDYGLNLEFGERVFVNQNCAFYDLGGITIGERTMIGPGVTLSTAGHPVDPNARFDGITTAPIVIESNVWIGANVTIAPGVRVGSGSVIAAGAVIAKDVPANCVVSSGGYVKRRDLSPVNASRHSGCTGSSAVRASACRALPSASARVLTFVRIRQKRVTRSAVMLMAAVLRE